MGVISFKAKPEPAFGSEPPHLDTSTAKSVVCQSGLAQGKGKPA